MAYVSGTMRTPLLALAAVLAFASSAQAAPTVTEFDLPTPDAAPQDIVQGPDGNVWFTERGADKIGRVTPEGVVTEFDTLDGLTQPNWIAVGPDGNLWFTGQVSGAGGVGRMPPGDPSATESFGGFGIISVQGIAVGPDGNLWVVDSGSDQVERITTAGAAAPASEIATAGLGGRGITLGPDGNVWIAGFGGQKLGKITPAGDYTGIDAPGGVTPYDVVGGPDGNVWYAAQGTTVGRITANADATEDAVNFTSKGVDPFGITAGPDGAIWYAEFQANAIGRVDVGGGTTQITGLTPSASDPSKAAGPRYVTAGPQNTIWFTEETGNRVGRVSGIVTAPPPPPQPVQDVTKPELTGVKLVRRKLTLGSKRTLLLRFSVDEPGTLRLRLERALDGRRSKGRCVKPKRSLLERPACKRLTRVTTLARAATQGENSVRISTRFNRKRLRAGRYRISLTVADAAGNRAAAKPLAFTVVKPAKRR